MASSPFLFQHSPQHVIIYLWAELLVCCWLRLLFQKFPWGTLIYLAPSQPNFPDVLSGLDLGGEGLAFPGLIFGTCLPAVSSEAIELTSFRFLGFGESFFWLCHLACRISVPQPGIEPGPWQGQTGTLPTRPPGNSPPLFLVSQGSAFCYLDVHYLENHFYIFGMFLRCFPDGV